MKIHYALYVDIDPYVIEWTKNLIGAGLLPRGDAVCRDIKEIDPDELFPYTQCHFCCGINGWALALRQAGWPDERKVWTASVPCQGLSVAGKRLAELDPRHLWPDFHRLISACHPAVVLGEQVAGPDGSRWLAGVHADMEDAGYQFAAANLCAAGAGAPHLRQRYYFVADSLRSRPLPTTYSRVHSGEEGSRTRDVELERPGGTTNRMANSQRAERWSEAQGRDVADGPNAGREEAPSGHLACSPNADFRLALPDRSDGFWWSGSLQVGWNTITGKVTRGGREYDAQWRIKPGLSIVVNGVSNRVDKLRAIGNAVVVPLAAEFVKAYMECRPS